MATFQTLIASYFSDVILRLFFNPPIPFYLTFSLVLFEMFGFSRTGLGHKLVILCAFLCTFTLKLRLTST